MSQKWINVPLSSTLFSRGKNVQNAVLTNVRHQSFSFVGVNLSTRAPVRSRMTLIATYRPVPLSCTRAERRGGCRIGGASLARSDWRPEMRGGVRAASPILKWVCARLRAEDARARGAAVPLTVPFPWQRRHRRHWRLSQPREPRGFDASPSASSRAGQ